MTRTEAVRAQIQQCEDNIRLYARQKRSASWIEVEQRVLERLKNLLA